MNNKSKSKLDFNNKVLDIQQTLIGRTITNITKTIPAKNVHGYGQAVTRWDYYQIDVDGGNYLKIAIDNYQSCCEHWGIVNRKEKDESTIIGGTITNLTIDVSNKRDQRTEDYSNSVTITLTTTNGPLTIYLFNEHNGYYSHQYYIRTKKTNAHGQI